VCNGREKPSGLALLIRLKYAINKTTRLTNVAERIEQLYKPLLGQYADNLRFGLQYRQQITIFRIRLVTCGLDDLVRLRST
jgi:hypothetical protein